MYQWVNVIILRAEDSSSLFCLLLVPGKKNSIKRPMGHAHVHGQHFPENNKVFNFFYRKFMVQRSPMNLHYSIFTSHR